MEWQRFWAMLTFVIFCIVVWWAIVQTSLVIWDAIDSTL